MDSSQRIADRFQIQLAPVWKAWFDQPASAGKLPGLMREVVAADELTSSRPRPIWPGFMLPDTLPILGNEYGDYVCVRVTEENRFGELIYWYHGGGDWIPVGNTVAEAILHDAVDQFRDIRTQMIRGASESRIGKEASSLLSLDDAETRAWLNEGLPSPSGSESTAEAVAEIIGALSEEDYEAALLRMHQHGWAKEAVACDLIEHWLQKPLKTIATREFAKACGISWFPDFVSLLFDLDSCDEKDWERIRAQASQVGIELSKGTQDWQQASRLAAQVMAERKDLAWAAVVLGWSQEREGESQAAIETYRQGLKASSFTEQSVRLNSHAESDEYGKFSLARLKRLTNPSGAGAGGIEHDAYSVLMLRDHSRSILQEVSEYWMAKANEAEVQGDFGSAYTHLYSSGWDMGVSRLSEYETILAGLVRNARKAGWSARASVAELHLNCLLTR